jgi:hypothetical protein
MARDRPHLSITLPRNFTFHYTEGGGPKTPEQESLPPRPQSPQAYRIKRRLRPSVSSNTYLRDEKNRALNEVPIPTIETPVSVEWTAPVSQHQVSEPAEGYLAPVPYRHNMNSPRTPSGGGIRQDDLWGLWEQRSLGQCISRPMSSCSIMSDSSDDSSVSVSSSRSQGGSCTSPESDAPDPFKLSSTRKIKPKSKLDMTDDAGNKNRIHKSMQNHVQWTYEMDRHLWTAYLVYLQDPTVTPFKMLPGVAPPLGVCHRVAREARRTWRGAKSVSRMSSVAASASNTGNEPGSARSGGSPDTVKAERSGSNTPTGCSPSKPPAWPKTGPSTRRRLRVLCKRKPTIAPYYQRLLQTRSSSPESTHASSQHQSYRGSSPFRSPHESTPFDTRDVQVSLTASTAASMQPHGPLAQLASNSVVSPPRDRDWFNDPIVPWASPTEIPSDLGLGIGLDENIQAPQLGSPFGYHTWGPSRSRQHLRPSTPITQSGPASVMEPALKSPVRLHDTFPYSTGPKRRALHQLEDELSPGGTDLGKTLLEDLFGGPVESRHRRVRSRGFSLGDVNASGGRLESLFTPPSIYDQMSSPELATAVSNAENLTPQPSISDTVKRLGSPFPGVGARPPRRSPRHMTSASLSAYGPRNLPSIDQTLGQL